jgi:hypothetical protein
MALTSQLLLFSHALYAYVFEIVTLYNNLFKSHIQYSLRPKKRVILAFQKVNNF